LGLGDNALYLRLRVEVDGECTMKRREFRWPN
jgi:hypothetical protein